jgi:hypothetical protein
VSNYALEGKDADALDDDGIQSLFTDDEFEDLVKRVRSELLPRLADVRLRLESDHSLDEPPEEYMQQLLECFDSLKSRFDDDEGAIKIIDEQIRRTRGWIADNIPEKTEKSPRKLGKVEASEKPQSTRSIFDDIDANEDLESE